MFHYLKIGHALPWTAQYIVVPLDTKRGNRMKYFDDKNVPAEAVDYFYRNIYSHYDGDDDDDYLDPN